MPWSTDTLDKFTRITGVNYTQIITDFFVFNRDKKQKIYDYYSGESTIPDGEAFRKLDDLRRDFTASIAILALNKESFNLFEDWELFGELEDINEKLNTIYNSSKFLRSALVTGNYNPTPLVEITLGNQQTLEKLASDLNADDPQNDWATIFLNNQLTEEDYTPDGGAILQVSFQGADPLILTSVVDNINTAEKTFGKDVQSRIDFVNDDLKTLTYKETLIQSARILSTLKRGGNPEFPDQGIDPALAVGNTLGSVSFPAIFRQIYQNFATDDSFKSFAITDVALDGDALRLDYQVRTRSDEIQEGSLTL